jgi:hypothetical protein
MRPLHDPPGSSTNHALGGFGSIWVSEEHGAAGDNALQHGLELIEGAVIGSGADRRCA